MHISALTRRQRWLVLVAAFSAWMFAGLEISLLILIHRQAMTELLAPDAPSQGVPSRGAPPIDAERSDARLPAPDERAVTRWFAWFQCAFLCGAAGGGWLFGALGDRRGRVWALAASVLCYSIWTGASYFVTSPYQLLALRFLACLGVGGTWPNAVALVAEAWPDASRPLLAGVLGMAANIGFVALGLIGYYHEITPGAWRWVLWVGAAPAVVGLWTWWVVPESQRWRAARSARAEKPGASSLRALFRPPLLRNTLLGIALGSVPVIGTAANANWVVPWTDHVAAQTAKLATSSGSPGGSVAPHDRSPDYRAKAWTQVTRSSGAALGSLLGGLLASIVGRRLTYCLISIACLVVSTYLYGYLDPLHPQFHAWTFVLGFVGVTYFGWLPLYLPELFPTRVRAAGIGVSFNSGRLVAAAVVAAVGLAAAQAGGDYARIGFWTGMIYAAGIVVIWLAPRSTGRLQEN